MKNQIQIIESLIANTSKKNQLKVSSHLAHICTATLMGNITKAEGTTMLNQLIVSLQK